MILFLRDTLKTVALAALFEKFSTGACALLLLALAAGCGGKQGPPVPPPASVTVTLPLEHSVVDWEEYTGHLQSPETANVAARISGFIDSVPFKEGALVHKGDVLFVMDDRPFKADLDVKRANVAKDRGASGAHEDATGPLREASAEQGGGSAGLRHATTPTPNRPWRSWRRTRPRRRPRS